MAGEPGVPDRRDAGLAIGLVLLDDEELLHRLSRNGALRVDRRIAEHVVHHHAVGHRRKDRAEAVLAVEALADEGDRAVDGALVRGQPSEQQRLDDAQHVVDAAEEPEPRRLLLRRHRRRAEVRRRPEEQFVDAHAFGVARHRPLRHQHQQRHDDRAAQYDILSRWNRKPLRQQHDLDRHHRHGAPRNEAEQRQQDAGEHVGAFGAAARPHRLACPRHVRGLRIVADHLQREIGLHRRADVEVAVVKQRPAAMRALDAAQIDGDLALRARRRPARRGSGAAARIRPGWWRRLRARTPNDRPDAGARAGRRSQKRWRAPVRTSPFCRR